MRDLASSGPVRALFGNLGVRLRISLCGVLSCPRWSLRELHGYAATALRATRDVPTSAQIPAFLDLAQKSPLSESGTTLFPSRVSGWELARISVVCSLVIAVAGIVNAQVQIGTPSVETRHLAGPVHEIVLLDGAINMLASVGEDGILLVDTGYAATAGGAAETIEGLGSGQVKVIINTHGDPDHVGGNALLGPEAMIIANPAARRQVGSYHSLPEAESLGLPNLLITEVTTLYFNGEAVRILPMPGGHTSGDLMVHFTGSGVIAVGDTVLTGTFPDADPNRGGDAQRLVQILQGLEQQLPEETLVVPGHGENLNAHELHGYIAMIEGSIAAVRAEMAAGHSFEDVLVHNPLAPWAAWERAEDGLSFADWSGQIWASLSDEPRLSVCAPVTETLESEGIEAAVEIYRRLRVTEPQRWDFGENELNMLGYQLLQRDRVKEAIVIFELNVEYWPGSANPYDSLGEAYLTSGDHARAIANYQRSLEIDSGNTNAVAMLKKLGAE